MTISSSGDQRKYSFTCALKNVGKTAACIKELYDWSEFGVGRSGVYVRGINTFVAPDAVHIIHDSVKSPYVILSMLEDQFLTIRVGMVYLDYLGKEHRESFRWRSSDFKFDIPEGDHALH